MPSSTVGVGVHCQGQVRYTVGAEVLWRHRWFARACRASATGDTASAYGFDGKAFNLNKCELRLRNALDPAMSSAQTLGKMVGAGAGFCPPPWMSRLCRQNGAAAPATPAPARRPPPAPIDDKPSVDADKAVADARMLDASRRPWMTTSFRSLRISLLWLLEGSTLSSIRLLTRAALRLRALKDGGVTALRRQQGRRYLTAGVPRHADGLHCCGDQGGDRSALRSAPG